MEDVYTEDEAETVVHETDDVAARFVYYALEQDPYQNEEDIERATRLDRGTVEDALRVLEGEGLVRSRKDLASDTLRVYHPNTERYKVEQR